MNVLSDTMTTTRRRFDRSVVILGAILALLGFSFGVSVFSTHRLYVNTEARRASFESIIALRTYLRLATDAETGQRGYLITGDDKYLAPYNAAVAELRKQHGILEQIANDNPFRAERLNAIRARIEAKLDELQKTIAIRRSEGFESVRKLVLTDHGKKDMDDLRAVFAELEDYESSLLEERKKKSESSFLLAMLTELATAMLGLIGVAAAGWLLIQNLTVARQTAVQQFNERQKLGVTLSSIGDAVIATDAQGRITFINPVAQGLTGWTETEAHGVPLSTVFKIVKEATREPAENPAERALREGAIVGLANHTILIARDGTEHPIDDSAAPIRDERARIVGVILVFRDIATRRRAEIETQKARSFSENIVDTVRESLIVLTKDLRVRSANRSFYRMFETTPAETLGKQLYNLADGQWGMPGLRKLIEEIGPQNPTSHEYEFDLSLPSLGNRHFFSTVRPLIGDQTWSGELLLAIEDITDRKRAEAKLRDEDQRKDVFLATLAHELRNPLAPIRNALSAMKMSNADPRVTTESRTIIERQVEQLVRLIDDLLDVSRITIGRIELRRRPVALQEALTLAMEISKPLIADHGHELSIDVPKENIWLNADVTRLAQVFANLLNNGARHSNRGARIWLSARQVGDVAEVVVRDTGYGIPGDMLTRVFEMFARVERTSKDVPEGLGIGLSLVRSLVELHGGTVSVQSKGEGLGSEFTVRLPVMAEPPVPSLPSSTAAESPTSDSGMATPTARSFRIVVVDDNIDSCESLAMLLKMMGHEVEVAHDGVAALAVVARFKPRICLLDIGLPQLSGYQVARRIREMSGGPKMMLIAMTGWGQEKDKERAKEAGFDHHLVKPVDIDVVNNILEKLPD